LSFVLLVNDRIKLASALVEGVEPLAKTDDVLLGFKPKGKTYPQWASVGDQPTDAAGD
jgi:hypothetical protein